jgi:acyl carrier protein
LSFSKIPAPMPPRLTALLSRVFAVPADSIRTDSGPHDLAKWDSAGHMNLVTELEKEFDVQFSDDEVVEMISPAAIVETLERRGAQV